ncbi:MAG: cytochrome c biogenesis protein ResB [Desulfomonilia bacterium]|jgi:hypothetical protein
MKKHGRGLLKALSSLKLTVALLLFITALCVIGTMFPQPGIGMPTGLARGPWWRSLLSPYDIFHSIWFIAAGALLCVNLALCMNKRLKLRRRNLVMLLLHGGILLAVVGYALGSLGIDGFMEIPEGGSASRVWLADGTPVDLGFEVHCERFVVEYYDNGMPKEYISDLVFTKEGRVEGRTRLMVNHPAKMEGFNFYQQNYRHILSAVVGVSDGQSTRTFVVTEGDAIPLSPGGDRARVMKIWHDLMQAGPAVKLMVDKGGEAQYVWVFKNLEKITSRSPDIFEMMPGFNPSGVAPYTFSFDEMRHSSITGIGVRRDPGVPLAAAGGTFFFVGLMLVYLVPGVRPATGARPQARQTDRGTEEKARPRSKAKGAHRS